MVGEDLNALTGRRDAVAARIEVTALRLLAEGGIDSVTVQDVALATGISRRTFYRYFDSLEHLCLAAPRRALHRLARDIGARPEQEAVGEAVVNASLDKVVSEQELELQRLGRDIFLRDREPWMRIMARLDNDVIAILSQAIGKRLSLMGEDVAGAQLLAKVFIAVIHDVPANFDHASGGDSAVPQLRERLAWLANCLGSGPTTSRKRIDTV